MDYYEILQVSPDASSKEVKAAFRRLVLKYHPDINKSPDATKQFQRINEAYRALMAEKFKRNEWHEAYDLATLQDYFDYFGYVNGSHEYWRRHARETYEEWLKRQMDRKHKKQSRRKI